MPKKTPRNSFYFYMQSIMPDLRREGRPLPNGMQDVAAIAAPRWKALPDKDRERFEQMAKEYKKKMRGIEGDKHRLDNVGNIVADRKCPEVELKRRKDKEKKEITAKWPLGKDLMYEKFYLISFESLCKTEEGDFLPCEMGIVEFSLFGGITKTLHKFIKPPPIPLGYRYQCTSNSEEFHQIPLSGFEHSTDDYLGIWIELENFVNPNGEKKEYPPIFCLENDGRMVEYSMDWLHAHSCIGHANRLHKIYIWDSIVPQFYAHINSPAISESSANNLVNTTVFDYQENTTCWWHEEKECKYCALGTVKRVCYALSDALSTVYDFELTSAHLPSQTEPVQVTVISPSSLPNERRSQARPPRQQNWGSSTNNRNEQLSGPYASRDFRYTQPEGEITDTNPWEGKAPQTLRRPNVPEGASQPSPWGGGALSGPSTGGDNSEWPTLGGGGKREVQTTTLQQTQKPTIAEAVRSNQTQKSSGQVVYIDDKTVEKPTIHQAVAQTQQQRPTIHQAVAQTEQKLTLSEAMQNKYAAKQTAPSADTAPAPPVAWKSQLNPEQLGPAARHALAVQEMQRQKAAGNNPRQMMSRYPGNSSTENSASFQPVVQPAPQTAAPPRPSSAWGQRPPVQPGSSWGQAPPGPAQASNPWAQRAPAPTPTNQTQPAAPTNTGSAWGQRPPTMQARGTGQMMAAAGRGRGRGLYNPNMNAAVRPPPGLGQASRPGLPPQGLSNHMAGLQIEE